jgi:hypothetical protein
MAAPLGLRRPPDFLDGIPLQFALPATATPSAIQRSHGRLAAKADCPFLLEALDRLDRAAHTVGGRLLFALSQMPAGRPLGRTRRRWAWRAVARARARDDARLIGGVETCHGFGLGRKPWSCFETYLKAAGRKLLKQRGLMTAGFGYVVYGCLELIYPSIVPCVD